MDADTSKNEQSLFPPWLVCDIMLMVLNGLHHIHENNIVHRDLKAENCLIDSNNQLRIIDFGLSKRLTRYESSQLLVGTPKYMAPEVYEI